MEFKKILVPVDFSPCSMEAYRVAVTLARQFKSQLIIIHVIDNRLMGLLAESGPLSIDEMMRIFKKQARLRLRAFLSGHPVDVKIRRIIIAGVPFHEIVMVSRRENVDLIVMGRYGGTEEMEKIFFGSTAEKVVRVAPCEVLSITMTGGGIK